MRWVVLVLLASCRCKEPAPTPVAKPAHVQTSWAVHQPLDPPEDVYGVPAWSKVFALAFERKVSVSVPACVDDGGCLDWDSLALRTAPMSSRPLVLGRDEPLAFIGEQVTFLEEPTRLANLERAIDAAMTIDPSTAPIAAVLFQNDLWERIDAITHAIAVEPGAEWRALERLRSKLIQLHRHVALSAEQLAAIGSNEALVERQFPELLAGFAAREGWGETRSRLVSKHGAGTAETSVHAERHGQRVVFRVFVHHPAGPRALEQAVAAWPAPLPEGTRFVITAAPVHRTKEGELVMAPFITLLETRQARAEGSVPGPIGTLAQDVLEGRRSTLTRALTETGGLEKLAREALLPVGATCSPDFTARLPLAEACTSCHGPAANRLTGRFGNTEETQVSLAGEGEAAAAVVAAKRASPDFAVLGWE